MSVIISSPYSLSSSTWKSPFYFRGPLRSRRSACSVLLRWWCFSASWSSASSMSGRRGRWNGNRRRPRTRRGDHDRGQAHHLGPFGLVVVVVFWSRLLCCCVVVCGCCVFCFCLFWCGVLFVSASVRRDDRGGPARVFVGVCV